MNNNLVKGGEQEAHFISEKIIFVTSRDVHNVNLAMVTNTGVIHLLFLDCSVFSHRKDRSRWMWTHLPAPLQSFHIFVAHFLLHGLFTLSQPIHTSVAALLLDALQFSLCVSLYSHQGNIFSVESAPVNGISRCKLFTNSVTCRYKFHVAIFSWMHIHTLKGLQSHSVYILGSSVQCHSKTGGAC